MSNFMDCLGCRESIANHNSRVPCTCKDHILPHPKEPPMGEQKIQRYDHGTSTGPQPEDGGHGVRRADHLAASLKELPNP